MTTLKQLKQRILSASKEKKADLVLKNGLVLNVFTEEIINQDIAITDGYISGVGHYLGKEEIDCSNLIISPGFIDAHMHIESSMVSPYELSKAVVPWGTTTLIADPHEIVNVAGTDGLDFMLDMTRDLPLNVYFMLPSSVPATSFETNGAGEFSATLMKPYLNHLRILGLGEVMCYPDVIAADETILKKILLCQNLQCDGHSPRLTGSDLKAYISAGITSDHEATSFEEAYEKLKLGMNILIREGSAARNLEVIVNGIIKNNLSTEHFAFCTDDKHLEDIHQEGHIRYNIKKSVGLGLNPIKALKMATHNPARFYGLKRLGAIAPGYQADLVVLSDLKDLNVLAVYKNGIRITNDSWPIYPSSTYPKLFNSVHFQSLSTEKIALFEKETRHIIEIIPHEIETRHLIEAVPEPNTFFTPDRDYLKICVVERHHNTGNVSVGILKGYGLKNAAIATTVAHDSHNIIVAGDNDSDILLCLDHLKKIKGGYVIASQGKILGTLPLPIAGLMSNVSSETVQKTIFQLSQTARQLGVSDDIDPFITLSFLALPVIPELRLTDLGLFDVQKFTFI